MYPEGVADDDSNLLPTTDGLVDNVKESVKFVVLSMGPCATMC